ncbi:hypothetical protein [Erythrobacter rubeus]|uniref:Gene transfer agent family protein n=1 Tax=Erythrobacter rubeus TaxID=2760803 RepID=A0ABR8KPP6_9SPHN|nr:hypothetical protein [Erythrobacter rubeus]MBD2842708.1 hypothetical protein [Erythrobacter rubeus]
MAEAASPADWFGEASFTYGGETLTITFENMALLEAEGVIGESIADWLPELHATIKAGRNPQLRHISALIYGGLKINHPGISQKDVVAMAMSKDAGMIDAVKRALVSIEIPEDAMAEVGNASARAGNRQQRRAAKKK